ncbi:hypothetical protein B0H14DRAFT_2627487 [Mycena olivaceomarginata]|nr:hypothetical protein B0H14DRAFT_2627487 [Mycena olivaceomarginata]
MLPALARRQGVSTGWRLSQIVAHLNANRKRTSTAVVQPNAHAEFIDDGYAPSEAGSWANLLEKLQLLDPTTSNKIPSLPLGRAHAKDSGTDSPPDQSLPKTV